MTLIILNKDRVNTTKKNKKSLEDSGARLTKLPKE